MKKIRIIFFLCVRITIIGLCGRGGLMPRPKPAQNANAARPAFQSFSHVANVYWVLGTKSRTLQIGCECNDIVSIA